MVWGSKPALQDAERVEYALGNFLNITAEFESHLTYRVRYKIRFDENFDSAPDRLRVHAEIDSPQADTLGPFDVNVDIWKPGTGWVTLGTITLSTTDKAIAYFDTTTTATDYFDSNDQIQVRLDCVDDSLGYHIRTDLLMVVGTDE